MKEKIIFQSKIESDLLKFLDKNKKRKTLNFLNLHDIYYANNDPSFKKSLLDPQNFNFIDGFVISAFFSIVNLRRVPRIRGPTFTRDFLSAANLSKSKKHFFIVLLFWHGFIFLSQVPHPSIAVNLQN